MKIVHKPTVAEGREFQKGMEDGILAYCAGAHAKIFFDTVKDMRESQHFSKVKEHSPCILVKNHPVAIEEGDWIVEGNVVSKKDFEENWEAKRGPGRPSGG